VPFSAHVNFDRHDATWGGCELADRVKHFPNIGAARPLHYAQRMEFHDDGPTLHVRRPAVRFDRPLFAEPVPRARFAHGTSPGMRAADEPTQYVRGASESTYRSSVVILGVAASLTWLAVVVICLLA
jgi:hypothetical protein